MQVAIQRNSSASRPDKIPSFLPVCVWIWSSIIFVLLQFPVGTTRMALISEFRRLIRLVWKGDWMEISKLLGRTVILAVVNRALTACPSIANPITRKIRKKTSSISLECGFLLLDSGKSVKQKISNVVISNQMIANRSIWAAGDREIGARGTLITVWYESSTIVAAQLGGRSGRSCQPACV